MTATSAEASAPLTIGGEPRPGGRTSYSVHNPARPAEIVGYAPAADLDQLDVAVQAARRAVAGWRALD
ncbi:MAG: aldehyde dehydrogenase, partial [Mycobacterium sp.]